MNKLIRLSPTGIEYGDYAWNFASGCGNNAEGKCKAGGFKCWAYPITKRFADHYPNGFKPTIYPDALLSPLYLKKPSRILCAFMGDLFWDCPEFDPDRTIIVNGHQPATLKTVLFHVIQARPEHTFLFLTKQPQNLIKWSPFPDNCWPGVTATDVSMWSRALWYLTDVEAKVKYVSVEPYLGKIIPDTYTMRKTQLKWIIIGSQTKPYRPPAISDVKEIVQACDKAGVKVFLKDNLRDLLVPDALMNDVFWESDKAKLRQEVPV